MCSQNLKRRFSDRNYSNNDAYDDLRHRKLVKVDYDSTYRKAQPRSDFSKSNNEEFHGSTRKLNSRNHHNSYYGQGDQHSRNHHSSYYGQGDQHNVKRSKVGHNKNGQTDFKNNCSTNQQRYISQRDENRQHTISRRDNSCKEQNFSQKDTHLHQKISHRDVSYKQQNFPQKVTNSSRRDTYKQKNVSHRYKQKNISHRDAYEQNDISQKDACMSTVINAKGKGNWDFACALAYQYLYGDFEAQNEASDYRSSSPTTSTKSSPKYSKNYLDLNQMPEDYRSSYPLTSTTSSSKCSENFLDLNQMPSDYNSSSPSTSTTFSSNFSENCLDLNQMPEDDDGVNFSLYVFASTTPAAARSTV